jgi:hypothetical protein
MWERGKTNYKGDGDLSICDVAEVVIIPWDNLAKFGHVPDCEFFFQIAILYDKLQ